jgi:hypothetical protein
MRHTMRESIEHDRTHVTVLALSSDEQKNITWMESDEFELNGNRYDLVKAETRNNITYYYCVHDHDEEQLVAAFKDHSQEQSANPTSPKASKEFVKLMLKKYSFNQTTTHFYTVITSIVFNGSSGCIMPPFTSTCAQPPELA